MIRHPGPWPDLLEKRIAARPRSTPRPGPLAALLLVALMPIPLRSQEPSSLQVAAAMEDALSQAIARADVAMNVRPLHRALLATFS